MARKTHQGRVFQCEDQDFSTRDSWTGNLQLSTNAKCNDTMQNIETGSKS
jgi:hypothetical protein